jgi:CarboxypepD_reg-like domain
MNKFKVYLFALSIICLPLKLFSQCVIKGTAINTVTKKSVPNASVSLKKEKVGVSANQNGVFEFKSKCITGDTLIVSAINYQTEEIEISKILNRNLIELKPVEKELSSVIVKLEKKKESAVLNEFDNCSTNYYLGTESVHQMAQSYNNPFPNVQIKGLELCKLRGNSTFRIRFYNMDSITMKPLNEITETFIEVKAIKRKSFINLEKYDIKIKNKTFYLSIEWLLKEENAYFEKIKINGKKIKQKYFEPSICTRTRKNENSISNGTIAWYKSNENNWVKFGNSVGLFLISVTVEKIEE